MNYLAHAYLSFNNPAILVGNLIADYVKGKQIEQYPDNIQKGIIQHRLIDSFTDKHPIVKNTKYIFRQSADRYDASFLDIAFDYFLANSSLHCPKEGWLQFTINCYKIIDRHLDFLPTDFINMYGYMKDENWLYNYRSQKILRKIFIRFASHLSYLPEKDHSDIYQAFEDNQDKLEANFDSFFPELIDYVQTLSN